MRRGGLTTRDLDEALRLQGEHPDSAQIDLAYLERNGSISLVPRKPQPRVLDVAVEHGVQTVRIELE